VVDADGVRHLFAVATAQRGANLHEQACDALKTIEAVTRNEGVLESIVHQAVFVSDAAQIAPCRQIIRGFYGDALPATSYIAQPPCAGQLLEIEVWAVGRTHGDVEIERRSEQATIVRHDGIVWRYCANVMPDASALGVYDGTLSVFRQMNDELAAAGFRFDQVVRTWLYLGDILGTDGPAQRYHELNRARSRFYEDVQFSESGTSAEIRSKAYPASTGIGADGNEIALGGIAMASERADVVVLPLENPRQTCACDYGPPYGTSSPKFSRATAIVTGATATLMISGTAGIVKSEARNIGDVAGQTHETLDNIAALISAENFGRHGVAGCGATLDDLALVRVYVKRPADYPAVRAVCEARLGAVPAVYAVADICRGELLVEIEGIAYCRRARP
jgi:enamine deaminase RidA (YjgF/YER057c/UK114 family)